jgi:Cytochrome C and Quinol oxidase polypeptide I
MKISYQYLLWLTIVFFALGCREEMRNDSRLKPLQEDSFFADRNSSRSLVPNTIPQGAADNDDFFFRGEVHGKLVRGFPGQVTRQELDRGRKRLSHFLRPVLRYQPCLDDWSGGSSRSCRFCRLAEAKLNLLSWYIFVLGGGIALYALLIGGVDTGWTFYTPYSSTYSNSHVALMAAGVFVAGFSSILTGLNFIVTTQKLRAPGSLAFLLLAV